MDPTRVNLNLPSYEHLCQFHPEAAANPNLQYVEKRAFYLTGSGASSATAPHEETGAPPFPFLALPEEIRRKVYELLLLDDREARNDRLLISSILKPEIGKLEGWGLLCVCKQISEEALEMLYSINVCRQKTTAGIFFDSIGDNLRHIRSISLRWDFSHEVSFHRVIRIIAGLPRLTSLEILMWRSAAVDPLAHLECMIGVVRASRLRAYFSIRMAERGLIVLHWDVQRHLVDAEDRCPWFERLETFFDGLGNESRRAQFHIPYCNGHCAYGHFLDQPKQRLRLCSSPSPPELTSPSSTTPPPILKLPDHLISKILANLIPSDPLTVAYVNGHFKCVFHKQAPYPTIPTPLSSIRNLLYANNRRLSGLALDALYTDSVFHLTGGPAHKWLSEIGARNRAHVRQLRLDYDVQDGGGSSSDPPPTTTATTTTETTWDRRPRPNTPNNLPGQAHIHLRRTLDVALSSLPKLETMEIYVPLVYAPLAHRLGDGAGRVLLERGTLTIFLESREPLTNMGLPLPFPVPIDHQVQPRPPAHPYPTLSLPHPPPPPSQKPALLSSLTTSLTTLTTITTTLNPLHLLSLSLPPSPFPHSHNNPPPPTKTPIPPPLLLSPLLLPCPHAYDHLLARWRPATEILTPHLLALWTAVVRAESQRVQRERARLDQIRLEERRRRQAMVTGLGMGEGEVVVRGFGWWAWVIWGLGRALGGGNG
ncbi:MAG: hypothetical protein M1819_003255 [Sarea resinae]|nr:MAG: hypothetical protein M1819_003255 [Sarea resinae]